MLDQKENFKFKGLKWKQHIYIYIYREREREREREHIYIYIYKEMGASYTWCNFTRVTPFLDHWFVLDLRVKKTFIAMYLLFPRN